MANMTLTVKSNITPDIFREFALFDAFIRRRAYLRPLLFAAIMSASAAGCFLLRSRAEQAMLLCAVLLVIGIGLPVFYIIYFLNSVRVQAKHLEGSRNRAAYTVQLTPAGMIVSAGKDRLEFAWNELIFAYRLSKSICLYVSEQKAYLLPAAEGQGDDALLWDFVASHLPKEKWIDLRKKKKFQQI